MPVVTVTRRLAFNAAHRLHNCTLSDEENRALYGKDNNSPGHGHNYTLDVSVTGDVNVQTGYVIDLGELRQIVQEQVVDQLDHQHMNVGVAFLRGINPTSENLVVACWQVLEPHIGVGRLTRLRLHETGNNYVDYEGE